MACYDRRILVPYLEDVCCAEMLCAKLSREITECQNRVNRTSSYVNQELEIARYPDPVSYTGWWFLLIPIAMIITAFCIWGTFVGMLLFWGGCGLFYMVCSIVGGDVSSDKSRYEDELAEYARITRYNDSVKKNLASQQTSLQRSSNQLSLLKNRHAAALNLRKRVYSVNIIPDKYRNIYAAYYLYNYFRTSRENDLDKIIQTMLLDDIRRQLKTVVMQNEQILLNQRVQTALQERNNRMMAENHQREMQQLIKMETNQQLQMDYQKMMIENQMVTNYFLEAEYLRHR